MLTLLGDKAFSLQSQHAIVAHQIATDLSHWTPDHENEGSCFERKLVTSLCTCFPARGRSQKVCREKMWASYHTLRCSETYHGDWQTFTVKCQGRVLPNLLSVRWTLYVQRTNITHLRKLLLLLLIHHLRTKRQMPFDMLPAMFLDC